MSGTSNVHTEQLWRLRDHCARDGVIDADEQALLDCQEAICDATSAAHGLLFRAALPRRIRRERPDLVTAVAAVVAEIRSA